MTLHEELQKILDAEATAGTPKGAVKFAIAMKFAKVLVSELKETSHPTKEDIQSTLKLARDAKQTAIVKMLGVAATAIDAYERDEGPIMSKGVKDTIMSYALMSGGRKQTRRRKTRGAKKSRRA